MLNQEEEGYFMLLIKYLENPCGTSSIPYWKQQVISIPENIKIYHEKLFNQIEVKPLHVEKYFRLIHHLNEIPEPNPMIETIDINKDLHELITLVNLCYADQQISVDEDDVNDWLNRKVYLSNLWVKIVLNQEIIAIGIAEYDSDAEEGVLEWIQVNPKYHGKGYGKIIVNELINRLSGLSRFITASGKLDNKTNPEILYRRCGFVGHDVWYVCKISDGK
jgi:GNAT superfamily N-acetyltransferase